MQATALNPAGGMSDYIVVFNLRLIQEKFEFPTKKQVKIGLRLKYFHKAIFWRTRAFSCSNFVNHPFS